MTHLLGLKMFCFIGERIKNTFIFYQQNTVNRVIVEIVSSWNLDRSGSIVVETSAHIAVLKGIYNRQFDSRFLLTRKPTIIPLFPYICPFPIPGPPCPRIIPGPIMGPRESLI